MVRKRDVHGSQFHSPPVVEEMKLSVGDLDNTWMHLASCFREIGVNSVLKEDGGVHIS